MIEDLFGFDWKTTGPLELVRRGRQRAAALPSWAFVLAGLAVAVAGALAWYFGVGVPAWAWLVGICVVVGAGAVVPVTFQVGRELANDSDELLEELNPIDGDRATRTLSPDRFADMRVYDHTGRELDKTALIEVRRLVDENTDGEQRYRKAYEIDRYLPKQNVAIASYMAGASNADLRRHTQSVELVKKKLSAEADLSYEEIVKAPEVERQAASSAINTVIQTVEGVLAPGDHSLVEDLNEMREESEKRVDQVLADRGIEDFDQALEAETDETVDAPDSIEISVSGVRGDDDD